MNVNKLCLNHKQNQNLPTGNGSWCGWSVWSACLGLVCGAVVTSSTSAHVHLPGASALEGNDCEGKHAAPSFCCLCVRFGFFVCLFIVFFFFFSCFVCFFVNFVPIAQTGLSGYFGKRKISRRKIQRRQLGVETGVKGG